MLLTDRKSIYGGLAHYYYVVGVEFIHLATTCLSWDFITFLSHFHYTQVTCIYIFFRSSDFYTFNKRDPERFTFTQKEDLVQ